MNEAEGARVICDACGKETAINLWTREIAKERDGYFPVVEKYFCCEACGKHYTVGVYDHEQSMNVQKRRRIQRMAMGARSPVPNTFFSASTASSPSS